MRSIWFLTALLFAGCASYRNVAVLVREEKSGKPVIGVEVATVYSPEHFSLAARHQDRGVTDHRGIARLRANYLKHEPTLFGISEYSFEPHFCVGAPGYLKCLLYPSPTDRISARHPSEVPATADFTIGLKRDRPRLERDSTRYDVCTQDSWFAQFVSDFEVVGKRLASLLRLTWRPSRRIAPKTPIAITNEDADIYEAVFRHQFGRNASAVQQSAGSYLIQIQDADPTDAFLLRFSGSTPPVKRVSEGQRAQDTGIYDRKTHKPSLIFNLGAIRWHGKNSLEVDGGYYEGNMSSSCNTYRLKRQGTKWKIIKDTMTWISDARTLPTNSRST
jgi:hypothetical protein